MNNLLPIFLKLENTHCLIVGGGNIALQKINQLLDCNADVTVVAPNILADITSLPVRIVNRKYRLTDLQNSKIVIAATNDPALNKKISIDANNIGIPVNVVDIPELCSFYMGSVFQDGDLKIAISTNGKCPSFGIFLKDHIINMSKGLWGKALDELAIKREQIIKALTTYSEKKQVMEKMVGNTVKRKGLEYEQLGKVYLVGAGPGDPELITAKGLKAIQSADIIFHDALIHPYLVFEVNPVAKKIFIGKRQDVHSVSQETIHLMIAEEVEKGKNVVRLKGGDPFVFGRGGEETLALAQRNIPFEIIPGVTAGLGAAAEFGIPLTHRDDATSTLFITGHHCRNSNSQDWETLAKLDSTLVFYMGLRRINKIIEGLLQNGKYPDTPIAIIQNATLQSQSIIVSTLDSIIEDIQKYQILTPAIIIIGKVVDNYNRIQNCLHTIPANTVDPIEGLGFDIWKSKDILA